MLEFCPVCKKLLILGEWKGKKIGKCSCGFMRTSGIAIEKEEKIEENRFGSGFSDSGNGSGLAFICKKCGFNQASAKELGEILGNEKSVTLFTCLKCGSAERI